MGDINETAKTIDVTVPYATDVTGLVATFTTTGASVTVDGVDQESGTTENDFTDPVVYRVRARANSDFVDYTVAVTAALNDAKAIMAFTLPLPTTTTIDETAHTITVRAAVFSDPSALAATFVTTGDVVKVGAVVQVSGTTTNDFNIPVTFMVYAEDDSEQDYIVTLAFDPAGDTTASAQVLTASPVAGTTVGYANDYAYGGYAGQDIVYRYAITIPAGKRLALTATPTGWDLAVCLLDSTLTLLSTMDAGGSGVAESLAWNNGTASALSVYIIVDASAADQKGAFDLTFAIGNPPMGDIYATATAISGGSGTLANETTVGYLNDYELGGFLGPDRVYAYTIPVGKTLSVTATPGSWDAAICIVSITKTRLASSNVGGSGVAENAAYLNGMPFAMDVYIIVDGYGTTSFGIFDLTWSLN